MSNSVEAAGLRFTPRVDGFLISTKIPGGEHIGGVLPIAALDTLRAAWDAHQRDVVLPLNAVSAAFRKLCDCKGRRHAADRLHALTGVDELGRVPRERYADLTAALTEEAGQ